MRPVVRGKVPKDSKGADIVFKKYGEAKRDLIDRIGKYCSYCERRINSHLAIEHVRPKKKVPKLKLKWTNFLLACSNCNSAKGEDDLNLADYFWPDTDNPFAYLLYNDSGLVKVKSGLSAVDRMKAENTIKLTGLDKLAPKPNTGDFNKASDLRVEDRLEAWREANDYLEDYESTKPEFRKQMAKLLVTIVKYEGFWSIWMTVFQDHPTVTQELVNGILGTNKVYFSELV